MKRIFIVIFAIMFYSLTSCQTVVQNGSKTTESETNDLTTVTIDQISSEKNEETYNKETDNNIESETLQQDSESLTYQTINSLKNKGWQDIETVEGELDFLTIFHVVVNPFEHKENETITTVLGRTTLQYLDVYAIVRIVSSVENNTERIGDILYVSESGRILDEEYFDIIKSEDAKNDIVSADNEELINYFEAY